MKNWYKEEETATKFEDQGQGEQKHEEWKWAVLEDDMYNGREESRQKTKWKLV
jgi:hypothetical protein